MTMTPTEIEKLNELATKAVSTVEIGKDTLLALLSELDRARKAPCGAKKRTVHPELTPDRLREVLHYCTDTGVFRWQPTVTFNRGRVAGVEQKQGYRNIWIDGRVYQAHRLAWFYVHGRWPASLIDHIDRNRTNNRIANLREATHAENQHNSRTRLGVSQLKGVVWRPKERHWAARIKFQGRELHIGSFDNKGDAARAYDAKAIELRGAFAATNASLGLLPLASEVQP